MPIVASASHYEGLRNKMYFFSPVLYHIIHTFVKASLHVPLKTDPRTLKIQNMTYTKIATVLKPSQRL